MKIVITGGLGFIGSHVAQTYLDAGHEVMVVDDCSTGSLKNMPFCLARDEGPRVVAKQVTNAIGDIREWEPDVINHHAAKVSVSESFENPSEYEHANVESTIQLLLAAQEMIKKPRFILASSAGAATMTPRSPYGVSKIAAEHYVRVLAPGRYVILRYANVWGPRQRADVDGGVVAIFEERLKKGERCTIYGDGEQVRDFVHVSDVAEANLAALDVLDNCSVDIGTGHETRIKKLYFDLAKEHGVSEPPLYAAARPGEERRSVVEPRRARIYLNWQAKNFRFA